MENKLEHQPATQESVWMAFRETDRLIKESGRERERSAADFDRRIKEYERERKKYAADFDRRIEEYERERKKYAADSDRRIKEYERERKEYERERKKYAADSDRRMKKLEEITGSWGKERKESAADSDRRMKKLEEITGSWGNNHGSFAEEYFFNSFEKGNQNFLGEHFDDIQKNVSSTWQGVKDEYDIVLYNHHSVALIEVKYKAHVNDVPSVLKKAETYRILFPNYKDFKIYLGLASMSFYHELEQECIKEGIAVIKQVGDTVVINDKHLKVF